MLGRLTRHPNRHRYSMPWFGHHHDHTSCADVQHDKFVTNARCRAMIFGPDSAPDRLECGCIFVVIDMANPS